MKTTDKEVKVLSIKSVVQFNFLNAKLLKITVFHLGILGPAWRERIPFRDEAFLSAKSHTEQMSGTLWSGDMRGQTLSSLSSCALEPQQTYPAQAQQ